MQKGREVQDNVFEPSGFGDFGFHRSMMMPSVFGGRDPFDDPFFSDPFGRMRDPSSASSRSTQKYREKGVVIKELDSDDEGTDNFDEKISRSTMEPSIEHPDDDVNEGENSGVTYKNDHHKSKEPSKDHNRNMSFQTSKVTYGGIDGAYYTSTRTRRMGADGVVMEESKEADTTTGEATHRITRGINDKGHSVLRKLDSDGKVGTTQTLHNLNEDELARFEDAWKGNNLGTLPDYDAIRKKDSRVGEVNKNKVWSLPSLEQDKRARGFTSNYETGNNSRGRSKKVVRINIE
ncbi:unnamed protein product [Trifolium pratense]|uniref:Uncharacterized protein n=1 Tax=Trifolium pratense TaxID=57577 RepID=A0ACB0KH04_TRIPR|nr:unnamed protein product [Trifolium pratense]